MVEENIHHDPRKPPPLRREQLPCPQKRRMPVREHIHRSVHQYPVHQFRPLFRGKRRWKPFDKIPQEIPDPRLCGITGENDMTQKIQFRYPTPPPTIRPTLLPMPLH